jgi:hypothetical protein
LWSSTLARNRPSIRRQARRSRAVMMSSGGSLRSRVRLRALRRIHTALPCLRTRRSVVVRPVVFVAVAALRPDPGCEAADGDGADCDQGNPVAEGALLTGGRGRRVEWATRSLGSVVGHDWLFVWFIVAALGAWIGVGCCACGRGELHCLCRRWMDNKVAGPRCLQGELLLQAQGFQCLRAGLAPCFYGVV